MALELVHESPAERRARIGEEAPALLAHVGDLLGHPARVDWLVRGILERETLALLFGDPGAGKSFAALGMAAAIATGTPWHGHRTAAGPVAYIAGEGHAGFARRLKALEVHHGLTLADAPLYLSRRAVPMLDAVAVTVLAEELDRLPEPPALIVVDTLARAMTGGDENAAADVGAFVGACDYLRKRYRAALLLVHHAGHGDKGRARGSSALRAAVDVEMGLARRNDAPDVLALSCTKSKDAEPFRALLFELETVALPWADEDGDPIRSAVLMPSEHEAGDATSKGRQPLGPRDVQALDVLRELSIGAAATIGDWRTACERRGIVQGKSPEALERAMIRVKARLLDAGLIEAGIGRGVYLPTTPKGDFHAFD